MPERDPQAKVARSRVGSRRGWPHNLVYICAARSFPIHSPGAVAIGSLANGRGSIGRRHLIQAAVRGSTLVARNTKTRFLPWEGRRQGSHFSTWSTGGLRSSALESSQSRSSANESKVSESLCKTCDHMREITSGKGARFLLCRLSQANARFPKYPPQPVVNCEGYCRNQTISRSPQSAEEERA
jgi:hypothetical protein